MRRTSAALVGGTLKDGRRKTDAVLQRRLITLDMDSITAGEDRGLRSS